MSFATTVVVLAILWGAVTGSLTLVNLVLGAAVAALCLMLLRDRFRSRGRWQRAGRIASLAWFFLGQLLLSAARVALLVIRPDLRASLAPAIVAVPLTVTRDFEVALLANLITLTPGTLSVDVSADRKLLYVHALDCRDPDALRAEIATGFERRIIEAFQ